MEVGKKKILFVVAFSVSHLLAPPKGELLRMENPCMESFKDSDLLNVIYILLPFLEC